MSTIRKNFVFNVLLSVSAVLFPLISFPYTSRVLGPRGTGIVGFADSITQYIILFAALGIPTYGIREIAKIKHDKSGLSKTFSELVIIHFITTCLLCAIYLALIFTVSKFAEYTGLYMVSFFIVLLSVFPVEWLFQGLEQFKYITIRTLIVRTAAILLLYLLVKKPEDFVLYYKITLITVLLNSCINFYQANKLVKFTFKGLEFKSHLKPLVYILSTNIAISAYILLDNIILGFMAGEEAVGYYAAAFRINKILLTLISALSMVVIPQLSKAFNENDKARAHEILNKSFAYVVTIGLPLCMGLYVEAPFIINLFAGKKFIPAIITTQIMAPITLIIGLNNMFGMQVITPLGKEKYLLRCVVVGMIISVAFNIILIHFFSYNGAALTTVITELSVAIVTGYYANRFFKLYLDWKLFLFSLIASMLFIPANFLANNLPLPFILQSIISIILCITVYFISQIWIFRNKYLQEMTMSFVKKIGL